MVYVFLADGFEELEALSPVDILRRGNVEVKTVGVTGESVTSSHNVTVKADITIDEVDFNSITAVILPGGMLGTVNLEKSPKVQEILDFAVDKNLLIGAICAAPSVLGHKGILKGKKATCFTGFEKELLSAEHVDKSVVIDGNIITSKGAGTAYNFAFEILSVLTDRENAERIRKSMLCDFGE